eukprot:11809-Heterococcus_DN1.PRE.1
MDADGRQYTQTVIEGMLVRFFNYDRNGAGGINAGKQVPFGELLLCVALQYDGFVLHEPSDVPESIRHAAAVWLSETIVSYAAGFAELQILSHIPVGVRWEGHTT